MDPQPGESPAGIAGTFHLVSPIGGGETSVLRALTVAVHSRSMPGALKAPHPLSELLQVSPHGFGALRDQCTLGIILMDR